MKGEMHHASGAAHGHPHGLSRRRLLQAALTTTMAGMDPAAADCNVQNVTRLLAPNVYRLAWRSDSRVVAGANSPRTQITAWDADAGSKLWRLDLDHAARDMPICFIKDPDRLCSAILPAVNGNDVNAVFIDAATGAVTQQIADLLSIPKAQAASRGLATSADQSTLAVSFVQDGRLSVLRGKPGAAAVWVGPFTTAHGHVARFFDQIALSPDGSRAAVSFAGGEVQVYDVARNTPVGKFRAYRNSTITALAFVGNGRLVTCSDAFAMIPLSPWPSDPSGYVEAPEAVDFVIERGVVANPLRLWDIDAGRFLAVIDSEGQFPGTASAIDAGMHHVAAVFKSGLVKAWHADSLIASPNAADATLRYQAPGRPGMLVGDVKISPDGSRIAVAADGVISIISTCRS